MSNPSSPTHTRTSSFRCPPTPDRRSAPSTPSSRLMSSPLWSGSLYQPSSPILLTGFPKHCPRLWNNDNDSIGPDDDEAIGRSPFSPVLIDYSKSSTDSLSNYEVLEDIGNGVTSSVVKARSKVDNKIYAIKVKHAISGARSRENNLQEVYALIAAGDKCPNVVTLFSFFMEDDCLHVVTEYCEGGSVAHDTWIEINGERRAKKEWSEQQLVELLQHVAVALRFLHQRNVAHLDVKMENVLITYDKIGSRVYKLADLGLARALEASGTYVGLNDDEGDSRYVDAYLLNHSDRLCEADVFSLGASILEMILRKPLATQGEYWLQIRTGEPDLSLVDHVSSDFLDLLKDMIHPEPAKRPTCAVVVECCNEHLAVCHDNVQVHRKALSCRMEETLDAPCEDTMFTALFH